MVNQNVVRRQPLGRFERGVFESRRSFAGRVISETIPSRPVLKRPAVKARPRVSVTLKKLKLPKQKRPALGLRGTSPLATATPRRRLQSDPFLG